jgi:hypothetical protein
MLLSLRSERFIEDSVGMLTEAEVHARAVGPAGDVAAPAWPTRWCVFDVLDIATRPAARNFMLLRD